MQLSKYKDYIDKSGLAPRESLKADESLADWQVNQTFLSDQCE